MPQLTYLQQGKVNEILALYQNTEKEVHFKAPTGSGKTLMATSVIADLINKHSYENFIFIIATISSSSLPKQFESKIKQYKTDLNYNDFEVEYIESPSSAPNKKKDISPQIRIIRNKVYIFGKATFGKGRIYTEHEIIEDFIKECKQQGFKLVYIRDEAHIGAGDRGDSGTKTFETLMQQKADFILKMTATFNNKSLTRRVELTERDLKDDAKNDNKWLIKGNLQHLNNDTFDDNALIDKAIIKFREILAGYQKLQYDIRPAMLIQLDNEPTDSDKKRQFHETLKLLKDKLSQNGLSWVQYFGANDKDSSNVDNENFTLEKIARNGDPTDCIIFKIGPATGWDIPRACMLLQLRNICSSSLNIQTIGRIKRNPYPNLKKNDITDKYYIFSNSPKENNKECNVYQYKVRDEFKLEEFVAIKAIKDEKNKFNQEIAKTAIDEFLRQNKDEIVAKIKDFFDFNKNQFFDSNNRIFIKNPILLLRNIALAKENLNLQQKQVLSQIQAVYQEYFYTKPEVKWEVILLILLNYFASKIKDIAKKSSNINVSYQLKIENINPDIYYETFLDDNEQNQIDVANSNYLFAITKYNDSQEKQILDSKNEVKVAKKLASSFEYDDIKNAVKIWAKNPRNSNIYGEYLDENNNERRSYFDFVLKFKNGNYLYIEVKGNNKGDIDPEKTALLEKTYGEYFAKPDWQLFNKNIVICITKVSDDSIINQCFYHQNSFGESLIEKQLGQIIKIVGS